MSIEKRAAFKVGFLIKLAEQGITPDSFFSKVANDFVTGLADIPRGLFSAGASAGSSALGGLGQALLHGPAYAGAALGSAHAAMEAPSESGIDALKRVEELGTLQRLTREIHARRKRHLNVQ